MVPLLVLLTIIVLLTVDFFVQRAELNRIAQAKLLMNGERFAPAPLRAVHAFAPLDQIPPGLFLNPGHTWMALERTGEMRVGADAFPARLLGPPDSVEVLPVGTHLHAGSAFATLKRRDREITLHSPVDAVVTEVNARLSDQPGRLGTDPFGAGWIVRLQPQNLAAAVKKALVGEEALGWVRRELSRLRDLAVAATADPARVGVTQMDGGVLADEIATHLDDEGWKKLTDVFFAEGSPSTGYHDAPDSALES